MKITELFHEAGTAIADGFRAISVLHFREIIALLVVLVGIFVEMSGEGRTLALAFFALALGIGIFLRVRRERADAGGGDLRLLK